MFDLRCLYKIACTLAVVFFPSYSGLCCEPDCVKMDDAKPKVLFCVRMHVLSFIFQFDQ